MKFYVGNPGKKAQILEMWEKGYGAMLTEYRSPDRYQFYAIDNGAFGCWSRDIEWNGDAFLNTLSKFQDVGNAPDFVVVPDKVAAGHESLHHSLEWIDKLPMGWCDYYLAVQDGMSFDEIEKHLEKFDGIFIGGTIKWKWTTARSWAKVAHRLGKHLHIGRAGTIANIVRSISLGADSIDSSSWARNNTLRYIEDANRQSMLELGATP